MSGRCGATSATKTVGVGRKNDACRANARRIYCWTQKSAVECSGHQAQEDARSQGHRRRPSAGKDHTTHHIRHASRQPSTLDCDMRQKTTMSEKSHSLYALAAIGATLICAASSFSVSYSQYSRNTFLKSSDLVPEFEYVTETSDDDWVLRSMSFECLEPSNTQSIDPNLLAEFLMEIGACSVSITDHDKDTVQEEPIFREPLTSPDQSLLLYNKAITSEYWKRCNVVSHFPGTVDLMAVAILVQATFELDRLPSYSVDNIPDRDWVVHVQSSWKPIVVGQIILRFPWHSNEDVQTAIVDSFNDEEKVVDETKTHLVLQLEGGIAFGTGEIPKETVVDETKTHLVLQLEGGIAFGTGEHPTTRLCLLWIERLLSQHEDDISLFLDFGAGSGVLGMAACIIGKHRNKPMRSVGVEIDSDAIIIANKNSEFNACNMNTYLPRLLGNEDDETITFILKALQRNNGVGHLPQELSGQIYDACAMNILAGPLIMLQETVAQMIRPGGFIGLSGVLSHQADQVVQAYRKYFDSVKIEEESEGWVLITGIRKK